MIAPHRGLENALEPANWKGLRAEWIAIACPDGGIFTRDRWTSFQGCHTEKVHRAIDALIGQEVAVEENPPGIGGIGVVCPLLPQRVYPGAAWNTRRYFPNKLPVALDAERPVFVHLDPDYETTTTLRSWGVAHRGHWKALR